MRLGIVRGHVVLSAGVESLRGTRLLVVEPVTAASLAAGASEGGGKCLVAADRLAPRHGQRVAFVEGREAANPYWPGEAPVDAYVSLIVERTSFQPPSSGGVQIGAEGRR
jgi:microcompartment protein CcmK/EutM